MGLQILAIDDNEIVGWTLAARLWVAGYDVETACSAAEGFVALQRKRYDLILMDLEMPDMTGLQALERMRRDGLCQGAPVVLLTSSEDFRHVQAAHALGARGYLTKSTASTALIRNIERVLKTDDLIWIDDEHSVARPALAADDDKAAFVSAPTPSDVRTSPPMIRLVVNRASPAAVGLGGR